METQVTTSQHVLSQVVQTGWRAANPRRRGGQAALLAAMALVVTGAAGGLFAGGSAQGTVIISDTFTGANGTAIVGRSPSPTDLPGTTWQGNGGETKTASNAEIENNQAVLGPDAGLAIDPVGGSVAASTTYTISTSFDISKNTATDAVGRGAGLGFFANGISTGNSHGWDYFTGVAVQSSGTGATVELIDTAPSGFGVSGNPDLLASATVSGFDASVSHTLSYSIDTSTGDLSNLLLDGNAISLTGTYTGPFTVANTANAGIYSSGVGGTSDTFDNFSLSVPEPAALGLMGIGGLAILLSGKRRKSV